MLSSRRCMLIEAIQLCVRLRALSGALITWRHALNAILENDPLVLIISLLYFIIPNISITVHKFVRMHWPYTTVHGNNIQYMTPNTTVGYACQIRHETLNLTFTTTTLSLKMCAAVYVIHSADTVDPYNTYRQTSSILCIKSINLNVSRLVLQLSSPNLLKPCVKTRMKM